jgi:glycine oxidase
MSHSPRIHVAGAGALGLACAVRLAQAGAQVTVFDPSPPAASASGVAAGMLAPAFEAVLDEAARPHHALLLRSRDRWPAFAEAFGLALDRRGAMAVGDEARLERLEGAFSAIGLAARRIGAAQMGALAPGLSSVFDHGLLTDEDWRMDPGQGLDALRAAARGLGVVFRAEALVRPGDADQVVIATGASHALADMAPELAHLSPIKGHILRLPQIAYDGVVVRGPEGYAAPGAGGLVIGATMEAGVSDLAIDAGRVKQLQAAGRGMFPAVAGAAPAAAVGVRAATPDGLPLVGPGANPSVLLAVGARRNGWLLAPLVAEIVTAYAVDADPGDAARRLSPERFAGKPIGEGG